MHRLATVFIVVSLMGLMGCAQLGFTDRVLLRVLSPDGSVVAVCQEVPALGDAPPTRQVSFASEGQFTLGRDVVFRSADRVELKVCRYQIADVRRTGTLACVDTPTLRAVSVSESIRR